MKQLGFVRFALIVALQSIAIVAFAQDRERNSASQRYEIDQPFDGGFYGKDNNVRSHHKEFADLVGMPAVSIKSVGSVVAAAFYEQNKGPETDKDFMGRTLPPIARELVGRVIPPDIPYQRPGALLGWESEGFALLGTNLFDDSNSPELRTGGVSTHSVWVTNRIKKGTRIVLVHLSQPDRTWQIIEVAVRGRYQAATQFCDVKDHAIPEGQRLIGFLDRRDKRIKPSPRRPNAAERNQYRLKHKTSHPRECLGDKQTARFAALLTLKTGKLTPYNAKPLVCESPFFDPCPPD